MLVLTRRVEQSLLIGDGVEIKIIQVRGSGDQASVRLGIVAPPEVRILRKEVYEEVTQENRAAARAAATAPQDLTEILGRLESESGERKRQSES
ncbi:MAG: carbon storage regulator [Firmicutes bacterium]|nr:carbon storage regulator [Bacillota bacterium]